MMKKIIILIILVCFSCKPQTDIDLNPNFVFILADDLGYGELGIFGQKMIETPNIDQLAKEGMILTDHYTGSPVCAPARAVLLTGLHSGNNPIRGNDEWKERGDVWSFQAMLDNPELEGQRPMPDSIVTVAKFLQSKGYKTGMVGKWGLGAPNTNSIPNNKGFDFFYGYNCQRQAHTLYPSHLWRNKERHILDNKIVNKGRLQKEFDPYNSETYNPYNQNDYAPTLMHNEALRFLERNKENNFFLYYASPIPHLPLQAPKKWVNYYHEKFGEEGKGWLTETELTEAINTWVEDYDYRIPLYYDCNYSPWQEVADKMRELVDTISALNDPSSFSEQVAEMDKEFQDMRADLMEDVDPGGGEKDAPAGKGVVKNFFKKHFAIKIQAIDPPKKKEELLEEAAAEGQNLDVGEILTATESENSTYNLAAKKAELEGNFWASYREDSGAITTDLVSKIGQLSGIVTLSTTDANLLPGLRDSAKALRKKQGKGTPGG